MSTIEMVSKLKPKDLGNPKQASRFTDDELKAGKLHFLGSMIGLVTDVKRLENKDTASVSYLLLGIFEGTTAAGNVLRSSLCQLPAGVHDTIVQRASKQNSGLLIGFAYKISTRKAAGDVGYEYVSEALIEPASSDVLTTLRAAAFPPKKK